MVGIKPMVIANTVYTQAYDHPGLEPDTERRSRFVQHWTVGLAGIKRFVLSLRLALLPRVEALRQHQAAYFIAPPDSSSQPTRHSSRPVLDHSQYRGQDTAIGIMPYANISKYSGI